MHYYILPQLSEQWVQSGLIGPFQWNGIVEILDATLGADGFPMQLSTSILPPKHSSPMSCSSMAYIINFLSIPPNLMIMILSYLYVSVTIFSLLTFLPFICERLRYYRVTSTLPCFAAFHCA